MLAMDLVECQDTPPVACVLARTGAVRHVLSTFPLAFARFQDLRVDWAHGILVHCHSVMPRGPQTFLAHVHSLLLQEEWKWRSSGTWKAETADTVMIALAHAVSAPQALCPVQVATAAVHTCK